MTFKQRIQEAPLFFGSIMGVLGGAIDGLFVISSAPHLFNGFWTKASLLGFSVGIYGVVGAILGSIVALVPPSWLIRKNILKKSSLVLSYLSILLGLSIASVIIVENFNFNPISLWPDVVLIAVILAATYFFIQITAITLNKIAFLKNLLLRWINLAKSKLAIAAFTVVFILSTANVVMLPMDPEKYLLSQRPNIILISFDTLSAKHMGCYSYAKPTTPNIDRFAQDGVLFENHFSVARLTLPSHMSMFTSVYPSVHKVIDSFKSVLDNRFTTLAEVLRKNGYETGAFVDGNRQLNIGAFHGFDRGFDFYEHYPERYLSQEKLFIIKKLLNFTARYLHRNGVPDVHSEKIFTSAINWMDQRQNEEPFFLFLHTYDIHSDFGTKLPYVSPESFQTRFTSNYSGNFDGCDGAGSCATETLINYNDYYFIHFIQSLQKRNLWDNTIIMVTSDHGEEFLEHRQLKHYQHYDEVLKVPLIIRYPEGLKSGTTVNNLTRSIDLFPTILELADIEHESSQFQGVSLVPLADGGSGVEELILYGGQEEPWDTDTKVMRTLTHKYIMNGKNRGGYALKSGEPEELYDLRKDPGEKENIIGTEISIFQRMNDDMTRWADGCIALRSEIVPTELAEGKKRIDQKSVETLKSLGYIR
jgi:arylsulfatase A-like enzyme